MSIRLTVLGTLLLLSITGTQANADLVTNGDFETGDLTGWTLVGDAGATGVDSNSPHLGSHSLFSGDTDLATLSQTLATIAGEAYTLSFWLKNDNGLGPNSFSVLIDGSVLDTFTSNTTFSYTNFLYDFVAQGNTTDLAFTLLNVPGYWDLDDVSVETSGEPGPGPGVVPVPATLPLLASGLGAFGFIGWRRSKKNKRTDLAV